MGSQYEYDDHRCLIGMSESYPDKTHGQGKGNDTAQTKKTKPQSALERILKIEIEETINQDSPTRES